ncbi:hypothetical protein DPMN_042866 [Dreissena polymorpha]|uniref:Uncharacterized protein n=1 Tax=Dreissena polymorpha TaxID=45954 RepID=A0A9D4CZE3_DREPO|nr:hypothetical protein DPMN_042866 [Dreissena polymorpha]
MFEKLFVVFTNADTFSVVKLHEIRARLDLMQEKPAIISVSEVKPKNLKFERQLSEYIIEGNYSHVLTNGDLNYPGIDWENTSTSQGPGEMENEFLESDNSSDENEELALKDGYTNLLLERHL